MAIKTEAQHPWRHIRTIWYARVAIWVDLMADVVISFARSLIPFWNMMGLWPVYVITKDMVVGDLNLIRGTLVVYGKVLGTVTVNRGSLIVKEDGYVAIVASVRKHIRNYGTIGEVASGDLKGERFDNFGVVDGDVVFNGPAYHYPTGNTAGKFEALLVTIYGGVLHDNIICPSRIRIYGSDYRVKGSVISLEGDVVFCESTIGKIDGKIVGGPGAVYEGLQQDEETEVIDLVFEEADEESQPTIELIETGKTVMVRRSNGEIEDDWELEEYLGEVNGEQMARVKKDDMFKIVPTIEILELNHALFRGCPVSEDPEKDKRSQSSKLGWCRRRARQELERVGQLLKVAEKDLESVRAAVAVLVVARTEEFEPAESQLLILDEEVDLERARLLEDQIKLCCGSAEHNINLAYREGAQKATRKARPKRA